MLPFTRETPGRVWLGFVDEADAQKASVLTSRVLPVLAVAGVAALVLSGGKQSHAPQTPPPSSAAAARMQVAAAGAAGSDVPDSTAPTPEPEPTPPPAEKAEPANVEPAAAAPVESSAVAQPAPATEATPAEPAPQAQPPKPKRQPKPPKPLSPSAAKKASRAAAGLRSAIAAGRVKASRDNFAATSVDGDEVGWDEAKAACSGLDVDGVGGWRLPSRGEAREIHRGGATGKAAYWTRQRGPHDDTIYVYDPRTRRSSPWLDQEIASVVCVQPRPRKG